MENLGQGGREERRRRRRSRDMKPVYFSFSAAVPACATPQGLSANKDSSPKRHNRPLLNNQVLLLDCDQLSAWERREVVGVYVRAALALLQGLKRGSHVSCVEQALAGQAGPGEVGVCAALPHKELFRPQSQATA